MWHLKTRLGVFWVAPLSEVETKQTSKQNKHEKYYLGVNDEALGIYNDADEAAKDVHDQKTGYYKWDLETRVQAPLHINEWAEGEPKDWR